MKNLSKFILLFVLVIADNILLAQYNAIPDVRCYIPGTAMESSRTFKVSDGGVIFRSVQFAGSPTSGTTYEICRSINDNVNSQSVGYGGGGSACCYMGKMEPAEDSTLVFSSLNGNVFSATLFRKKTNSIATSDLTLMGGYANNFSATKNSIYSVYVYPTGLKPIFFAKYVNNIASYDTLSYKNIKPLPLPSIFFVNDSTGFVFGKDTLNNNTLIRTDDYGNNWIRVLNPVNLINDINFDGDTGLAVGNVGIIYKSVDKGINWSLLPNPTAQNLRSVSIVNPVSYIAGDSATLIVSSNYGNSWTQEVLSITSNIDWVKLTLNNQVYFQSNNTLYKKNYFTAVRVLKSIENKSLIVYPNPTIGMIEIQLNEKTHSKFIASVINSLGEVVLKSDNTTINLNSISSGLYSVELKTSEGEIFRSKFVKID